MAVCRTDFDPDSRILNKRTGAKQPPWILGVYLLIILIDESVWYEDRLSGVIVLHLLEVHTEGRGLLFTLADTGVEANEEKHKGSEQPRSWWLSKLASERESGCAGFFSLPLPVWGSLSGTKFKALNKI